MNAVNSEKCSVLKVESIKERKKSDVAPQRREVCTTPRVHSLQQGCMRHIWKSKVFLADVGNPEYAASQRFINRPHSNSQGVCKNTSYWAAAQSTESEWPRSRACRLHLHTLRKCPRRGAWSDTRLWRADAPGLGIGCFGARSRHKLRWRKLLKASSHKFIQRWCRESENITIYLIN